MIAVVDYGVGNLRSAAKGLERAVAEEGRNLAVQVTGNRADIETAEAIVLPGVGAFGACVQSLTSSGLREAVIDAARSGRPFLGICVGMQILFEESDEFGPVTGLGILPGRVERLRSTDVPIPHMGWNTIALESPSPLFQRTAESTYFYFVHSYVVHPTDPLIVSASTIYGGESIPAAVRQDCVFGTQFHPEKSQTAGLRLLRDFVAEIPVSGTPGEQA